MFLELARIGSVLSMLGTGAWLLWPKDRWDLDAEPLNAFLTALVVWIGMEITAGFRQWKSNKSEKKPVEHGHDLELFSRIREHFTETFQDYLRHHDMGAPSQTKKVYKIFNISDRWSGIDWEFHDKDLEEKFSTLKQKGKSLAESFVKYSGPLGEGLFIVTPEKMYHEDIYSDEMLAHIQHLNKLATELLHSHEELARLARVKLPSAF